MDREALEGIVARARLAPSVHNTQPARWKPVPGGVEIWSDDRVGLDIGDPDRRDAGLSCGAAVEATVLAASALGLSARVDDLWQAQTTDGPLRLAARIGWTTGGAEDGLHRSLETRFTHRGVFDVATVPLFGWTRADAVVVTDAPRRVWLATLDEGVSLRAMRRGPLRREMRDWMRLSDRHPRADLDGLSRRAMRMGRGTALAAGVVLGPLWWVCDALGLTRRIVSEAEATRSAAVIACFHRPAGESPVSTGRAYLRLWLEATQLGLAGWPMAALADDPDSRAEIAARLAIGDDRRLVQVLRLGPAGSDPPPRARLPVADLLI